MWMLLPRQVWPAATEPHTDRDLMLRARGWAVVLGLAFLANSRDDAKMNAVGMATVNATLRN